MCRVDPSALERVFGLRDIEAASLSPWACVHRARTAGGQEVVVKHTASAQQRAAAMAQWTRLLDRAGVPVVTPIALDAPNPAPLEDEWWVVYPFVAGREYNGDGLGDVRAAGELLGRMHAVPADPGVLAQLRRYAWPQTTRAEVDGDLDTLSARLPAVMGAQVASRAVQVVRDLGERWWAHSLPALREADSLDALPRAGVSSDYKAANLVYAPPVLIDPDNGGLEPRLFDLAMAVVLFHHESPSAPGRLFTDAEWRAFYAGYAEHVTLTPAERDLWPAALDHMFWEEGTWVLEDNDDDAWADPRQGAYLRDLATTDPARFALPH